MWIGGGSDEFAVKHDLGSAVSTALANIAAGAVLDAWAFVATAAGDIPILAGPLSGMPFGAKDIIDVARMPTSFGIWPELRRARLDAWCVALLRAAGAVPVGKTRTTAHAYRDPAPSVNPLDVTRTPGGSSVGSAVAVAAGHVPFALGTQTIGSILRPAAYCGVVGFKPTWGRIPTSGVAPLAPSLDHVGVIAHDVDVLRAVARVLLPSLASDMLTAPRLAVATTVDDERTSPVVRAAVRRAFDKLNANGVSLEREILPFAVAAAPVVADLVTAYEAHAVLGPLLGFTLPPELRSLLERGASVSRTAYESALDARSAALPAVNDMIGAYDAVIVPSADVAPTRETTGDGSAFAPWSYFGMPAIAIPIPGTAPGALSLQLVGARGDDGRLLEVAAAVEAALR